MNKKNLTSEQIIAIATEVRNNLKILDEAIGCYALSFYGDDLKLQVFEEGLELVEGDLISRKVTGYQENTESSKTVNGIKFFALTDLGALAL
jgi:hypothetical protein